jgi:DNA-binding NarL/FixJ family response regulator
MALPISGINSFGVDLFAHSTTTAPETTGKTHGSDPKATGIHSERDTVKLSTSVKAWQMKEEGKSISQIANSLNLDVKTVNLYLGIAQTPPEIQAQQMKAQGKSVNDIANNLNLDVKTVNLYLGIAPTPADIQAQQMKEQGKSVNDIANNLNLDVKTVNLYLGIAPAPVESGTEKGLNSKAR